MRQQKNALNTAKKALFIPEKAVTWKLGLRKYR
jgi:hypothetical protein